MLRLQDLGQILGVARDNCVSPEVVLCWEKKKSKQNKHTQTIMANNYGSQGDRHREEVLLSHPQLVKSRHPRGRNNLHTSSQAMWPEEV